MDLFFLKKLISALIMPINIVFILSVVGLIFYRSKPRFSIKCFIFSTLLLALFSIKPIADAAIAPFEQQYESFTRSVAPVDYIIILGCGHITNDALPVTSQLYTCSLQRLVEAIRIYRIHPEATIITSGFKGNSDISNAEKVKEAAVLLGIPESKIIVENFPQDTAEEAELIAPRVLGKKVVLVTNADHMPRSMNYFIAQGVNPIAAPVGPVESSEPEYYWQNYLPNVYSLEKTTTAWYEALGLTVQWIKSWFK